MRFNLTSKSTLMFFALVSCGAAEVSGQVEETQQTIGGTLYNASWSQRSNTTITVRFPASVSTSDARILQIAGLLTGCDTKEIGQIALIGDTASIDVKAGCDPRAKEQPLDGTLIVQVATFAEPKNAERLIAQLSTMSIRATAVTVRSRNTTFNRIYAGPVNSLQEARELRDTVRSIGFGDAFIVRNPETAV